jgi:hypothetical protein
VRARPKLLLPILAALALVLGSSASSAWADGDPASDILLTQALYTPVAQKISAPVSVRLVQTIAAYNDAGFKIRVALILDRTDLGAVPQLFGQPDNYVQLLSSELFYGWKGGIIAVQPAGIGVRNIKPLGEAKTIVAAIKVAQPASADTLALAAITAIRKLGSAHGVAAFTSNGTTTVKKTSSGSSTTKTLLGVVLAIVLVLLLVGQIYLRRKRRAAPPV